MSSALAIGQLFSKYLNMDLNALVIEPVTFDDGDLLEGSSTTPIDAAIGLDTLEKEGGEHSSSGSDNCGDIDDLIMRSRWVSYENLLSYFVVSIGINIYHVMHIIHFDDII